MPPEIISYTFGQIIIDDKKYNKDVIIFPDRVFSNWWRKSGHNIEPDDLTEVMDSKPDVLIIGTGSFGMVTVPEETIQYIKSQGIEMIIERTKKALEHYYNLAKDRKTVAALHLTC